MLEAWGLTSPVAAGNDAMKLKGAEHGFQIVLVAYPGQARSLQASHNVGCDILATNEVERPLWHPQKTGTDYNVTMEQTICDDSGA